MGVVTNSRKGTGFVISDSYLLYRSPIYITCHVHAIEREIRPNYVIVLLLYLSYYIGVLLIISEPYIYWSLIKNIGLLLTISDSHLLYRTPI